MTTYRVSDGNGEIEVEAESAQSACQEFVDGGEWGSEPSTAWVTVTATEVDDPRYDAREVDGYRILRDLRQAAPESQCPEVDLAHMSTVDRDAVCIYLRADDDSLTDGDYALRCRIADAIEDLDPTEPESETHTIEIPPTAPDCCGGEHEWESPHSVVGGLKENPGVYGHGGGVIITEVCRHCGCYQVTDTWAQNPENGEQGLTSVKYREADDASEAWIAELTDAR